MSFGLNTAPHYFMETMNYMLHKFDHFVVVFIYDIPIFSKTEKEHEQHLTMVLQTLCDNKFFAKLKNYEFWLLEVDFSGPVINEKGISVDPNKVSTVVAWEKPSNIKERFVKDLSFTAKPLSKLTHTNVNEYELSFRALKEKLVSSPVLALPELVGLGCVVMQDRKGVKKRILEGRVENFTLDDSRAIRFRGCLCVPQKAQVMDDIIREAHRSRYTLHPSENKMYQDLKKNYWWKRMKIQVANWEDHMPLVEFTYNNSYHASIKRVPFEVLYGQKWRSPLCWDIVGENVVIGPDWVEDHVLLKVSPTEGVVIFGTERKLRPRLEKLAYRLELPKSMKGVHNVFHVSMPRKYLRDPERHIDLKLVTIEQYLSFEAHPIRILEDSDTVLWHRTLKYGKLLWTN
ncbi:hypothetical protein U9M48_013447 [Paspalum notatum var. saurae]|uniref:Reverse transcriptase domain-containing protein n=1 Tax=Paspalum notatum var. saurae TaxID=547442 RepID=A0AAQ3T294_PASNO